MYGHVLVLDDQMRHIADLQATKSELHEYFFVTNPYSALYLLLEYDVDHDLDLIACNVNLRAGDVFAFIKQVKADRQLSGIPLVCYCVTPDLEFDSIRAVAETLGADELIASTTFDAATICHEIDHLVAPGRRFMPHPGFIGKPDDFATDN
jgi:CheY-like chemotaxis protein